MKIPGGVYASLVSPRDRAQHGITMGSRSRISRSFTRLFKIKVWAHSWLINGWLMDVDGWWVKFQRVYHSIGDDHKQRTEHFVCGVGVRWAEYMNPRCELNLFSSTLACWYVFFSWTEIQISKWFSDLRRDFCAILGDFFLRFWPQKRHESRRHWRKPRTKLGAAEPRMKQMIKHEFQRKLSEMAFQAPVFSLLGNGWENLTQRNPIYG